MKILFVTESPLERIGESFYAVDPWIRLPMLFSNILEKVTCFSPVKQIETGQMPSTGTWKVNSSNLKIEKTDYYKTFVGYYRIWLKNKSKWKRNIEKLTNSHDVVIIRVPSPMLSLVTKTAGVCGKPLVVMLVGDIQAQSDRIAASRGLKQVFYKALVKILVLIEVMNCKKAWLIYVYSRELAYRHRKMKELIKLMRTPHLTMKDFIQREDTCQSDEIKILRVCWLLPSKGIEYLLKAISILAEKELNVKLEIVGKERSLGYQAKLQELADTIGINNRIRFTGWVPFDRIGDVYLRNDIHVISSLSEGTPRCIVEGFARGLPLVATEVGGCKDFLANEKNALLVPAANADAIAEAVFRIVSEKELRKKIIKQGYLEARSVTFEKLGVQMISDVQEVVNKYKKDYEISLRQKEINIKHYDEREKIIGVKDPP
ncbi:MAG: glycosyltransferase [Promethearchaeota archaeon]|jgi:glycosyltransferase involved in cell wall biosynthesis